MSFLLSYFNRQNPNVTKVSVIIPVYNSELYLQECLESVICQSLTDIEIIIVNDASTDSSIDIVNHFKSSDSRFKIVHHSHNQGLPAARNSGVAVATGEYIIHLDSDDFWIDSNALLNLYRTASFENCEVLRFNGYRYQSHSFGDSIFNTLDCVNQTIDSHSGLWAFRSVFCFFFKKSFIEKNKLDFVNNINIGEDGVFVSKALVCAKKISSISDHYYAYRIHDVSMMKRTWSLQEFIEEERATQIIANNLQHHAETLSAFIGYRLKTYWPRSLSVRLKSTLSQDERFQVYQEARKTFVKLVLDNAKQGPYFARKDKYLYQCFVDSDYQAIDKLNHPLDQFSVSSVLISLRKFIKNNKVLNWIYKSIKKLKNKYLVLNKLKKIFRKEPLSNNIKHFSNCENLESYNFSLSNAGKDKGISVMLRVKNEQRYIQRCLESIVDLFDEIVVIDNNSDDDTLKIVTQLSQEKKYHSKLKILSYPHSISRCGDDHGATPDNSVHSLVYYYNWCLSQCSFSMVCKWDADMIVSPEIKDQYFFRSYLVSLVEHPKLVMGLLPVQTVYYDASDITYLANNELNKEIRIFPNRPDVYFIKADEWEVLHSEVSVKVVEYRGSGLFEMKHVLDDEFSHWSDINFKEKRKTREFRNFQLVKNGIHLQQPDVFIPINL